ncbi:MAG: hypothetical protein KGD65_02790 [Candidatus Lokiarchaeota archaeon]|nr:hypothetical protein [Candidatus Lokiarchaeota archaeon]
MSSEESGKERYIPFIGRIMDYVGRSPLDFYSWGHIAFGIGAFSIFSLIITIFELIFSTTAVMPWWWIMTFVIAVGIGWEVIENTILWKLGVKFENRRDSFVNAFFDVIFVILGGLATWLLKWIIMDVMGEFGRWFYISALVLFVIILIAYFIGFYITNEETKKARKDLGKLIS